MGAMFHGVSRGLVRPVEGFSFLSSSNRLTPGSPGEYRGRVTRRGPLAAPSGDTIQQMTDEQIIGRVRGGETRFFEELVRRHEDAVFAMALRFIGERGDAEDVAQEVFLRVYRSLDGFKGDAKFSTWLYRITFNMCTDWLRRNRSSRRAAGIEEAGDVVDGRVDLEEGLLDEEERRRVRRALDGLEEKYRSVVLLLYYQKMSYDQIAEVLGMPLKTVETRLYRARKMLREALLKGERGDRV
jgi:RNA polymerase sigma factor (sigma-70 family)